MKKVAYICGALTELAPQDQVCAKRLYSKLADVCEEIAGIRAFVPHEHYDPIAHAHFTPQEVDKAERKQVCKKTSFLVVVALAPSWGGGIEVEMANSNGVPAFLLAPKDKRVSRLLRGNPAVKTILVFENEEDAVRVFRAYLKSWFAKSQTTAAA
jgi:hypothetical protein